jgi:hypothetical protein
MSFNSDRLNDYNSKSFNVLNYVDYDRFRNYKKININYTINNNNDILTSGPVFTAAKIVSTKVDDKAYTKRQEEFDDESLTKVPLSKEEYKRIK